MNLDRVIAVDTEGYLQSPILGWLKNSSDEWLKTTVIARLNDGSMFSHAVAIGLLPTERRSSEETKRLINLVLSGARPEEWNRIPNWVTSLPPSLVDRIEKSAIAAAGDLEFSLRRVIEEHQTRRADAVWQDDALVCHIKRAELAGVEMVLSHADAADNLREALERVDDIGAENVFIFAPIVRETEILIRLCQLEPDVWWVLPGQRYLDRYAPEL